MASADDKSLDGDDPLDSPSNGSVQPSMTMHPVGYSGMPMHMYPFPHGLVPAQPLRSKRRQVKNACTNCQKACKKCDDARPCLRCVKYGIAEECVDSQRKERKKGIKRGPYKKRDGKGNNVDTLDEPVQQGVPITNGGIPTTSGSPPMGPYMGPLPGFSGYYPPYQPVTKPGEGPAYYQQFYLAPVPAIGPQHHGGPEGENPGYPPHPPQFYPAAFIAPYPHPQPYPYGQMPPIANGHHYTAYGTPVYAKAAVGGPHDGGAVGRDTRIDGRTGESHDGGADK